MKDIIILMVLAALLVMGIVIVYYGYRFLRAKLTRPNTQNKRIALIVFPFFFLPSLILLNKEFQSGYGWWHWRPSITWSIFTMASVLCLIYAFSNLDKWITGKNDQGKDNTIE